MLRGNEGGLTAKMDAMQLFLDDAVMETKFEIAATATGLKHVLDGLDSSTIGEHADHVVLRSNPSLGIIFVTHIPIVSSSLQRAFHTPCIAICSS